MRIKLRRVKGFRKTEIAKMAKRDVAAFQYRYNRRYRLADMIERLAGDALRTPPMPYRLLNPAEVGA